MKIETAAAQASHNAMNVMNFPPPGSPEKPYATLRYPSGPLYIPR